MASPAAILSIAIRANTGGATTGILRVNQSLQATEQAAGRTEARTNKAMASMAHGANKAAAAFETVFKVMAIGGAAGAAAGLAYSVKKAADFEQQLSSLGSVADATGKQMATLRKQALKAGADTKFSALEAAQAQTELAKGGLTVVQIMKGGLKAALALAAAGEMDLADAATATVNAMKLFNLRGKDSMKVADAFATAANRTTADVKDFAMALSQGGSAAKAAGLSFNETVAYLESLAEAGIKNSDAGTSMKTALLQLANPTNKAIGTMDQLGLKFFDSAGNMKSLVDISGMLREKLGGLTREQRVQATAIIAGTDGMRGLLALYDAGPKKIAGFEKGLQKQGSAAEVAKKKQDNLAGSVEQLKGSIETLAIQIGTGLLPYLRTAADELTRFANKAGQIFARDDLSLGEKLQRTFDLAKVTVGPWVEKLKAAIDRANIPEKLAAAVSTATPMILKAAAMAGVTAAKTFAGAFASSDAWGKLALGVFLIRKLGLGGLLTRGMGGGAGGGLSGAASMAKPVPVFVVNGGPGGVGGGPGGVITGGGGTGTLGKVKGFAKGAGKLGAQLAALDFAINLVDQHGNPIAATINAAHDLTFGILPKVDYKTGSEQVQEHIAAATKEIEKLQKLKDFSGLTKLSESLGKDADEARRFGASNVAAELDKQATAAQAAADKVSNALGEKWTAQIRGNWKRIAASGANSMDAIRSTVASNMQIVKDRLGKDTDAGRQALAKNFRLAARAVQRSMDAGATDTKVGADKIRGYLIKALQSLGLTSAQATAKIDKGTLQNSEDRPGRATIGRQRGGSINFGAASGDSVPAMLERGEYVMNRNAVAKVGRRTLDRLNFAAAPRFQSGGIVALGRQLQRQGYAVSEHPAFGGVHAVHAKNSYHYRGMAIDINADNFPGGEGRALDRLYARLKGMAGVVELLWRVKGHFDHLHVAMSGAGGALDVPTLKGVTSSLAGGPGAITNRALKIMRSAAQGVLNRAAASMFGEGGETSAGGQYGKGALRRLWVKAGGSRSMSGLMAAIALAESGGNPNAANGPYHGLWQVGPGGSFDPLTNARQAVGKLSSQGLSAWEAYTNGSYRKFMRAGGIVPGTGAGDRVPAMLEPGEFVVRKQIVDRFGPTFFADLNGMQKGGPVKHPISAAHKRAKKAFENSQGRAGNAQAKAISRARAARDRAKTPRKPWDQNLQGFIDLFESQLAVAQLTSGTADDLEALGTLQSLQEKGLRQAQRRGDTAKITEYAQGLATTRDQITGLSTAGDPNQALIDSNQALKDATDAHTAALTDVRGELKRQTDLAQQWAGKSDFQKMKFISDLLSGSLGRDAQNRGYTPGAGFEVTY